MTKSRWAKLFAALGSGLTLVGQSGLLGKLWSPVALALGIALTGTGVWHASSTSAGHPNG